jgi:hypothetical protein
VNLSRDGREVRLKIPWLHPVNQVELKLDLMGEDGRPWTELAYLTINTIPKH